MTKICPYFYKPAIVFTVLIIMLFFSGCGIVPDDLGPAREYEVAVFQSPSESVRSYIHNLNTHDAYENFRHMRSRFRKKKKEPDGHALAKTLIAYSERDNDYIHEIQDMITDNRELMGEL